LDQFTNNIKEVISRLEQLDPIRYGKTRNFINGDVTYLSPYISRGLISTNYVANYFLNKGYSPDDIESLLQELAWRDYWQQIWINRRNEINKDLRNAQIRAERQGTPVSIVRGETGIDGIDNAIRTFYSTGYLHNHVRMYIASAATNVGRCAWIEPAKWMYYHLLDGDWASNALSWQWVCGAKSNKLYFANQENINKYTLTDQSGTFLDVEYDKLPEIEIPNELQELERFELQTELPESRFLEVNSEEPFFIYNYYNVDPFWRAAEKGNRILLLEPSVFEKYPVSKKCIDFCIDLAKENIPNVQIFVGEFSELQQMCNSTIYFKEHPLNNYVGQEDSRDWMSGVKGEFSSFFSFWKKVKKEIV
jgi:deoxyribodipyrimidine photo-lyase